MLIPTAGGNVGGAFVVRNDGPSSKPLITTTPASLKFREHRFTSFPNTLAAGFLMKVSVT